MPGYCARVNRPPSPDTRGTAQSVNTPWKLNPLPPWLRALSTLPPDRADNLRIWHRTQIIIPFGVVPPPGRKRHRRAPRAKHGERQDEERKQRAAVPRARDEVRVVPEDAWPVVA